MIHQRRIVDLHVWDRKKVKNIIKFYLKGKVKETMETDSWCAKLIKKPNFQRMHQKFTVCIVYPFSALTLCLSLLFGVKDRNSSPLPSDLKNKTK